MHLRITIILFLVWGSFCFGQQGPSAPLDDKDIVRQEINEAHLEDYRSDKDFNYVRVEEEESFLDKAWQWIVNRITDFFEWLFGVEAATGILKFIFNILPYLILALLIFLLIKFFVNVNSNAIITGQGHKPTMQFTDDEQIIKNEDINALIKDAIKQKNFRLAIRYYYLLSLKYLSDKDLIQWLPQKTNEDYIREIEQGSLQSDFKDATRIYDYVWYGEFAIDEMKFNMLRSSFETLNDSIRTP